MGFDDTTESGGASYLGVADLDTPYRDWKSTSFGSVIRALYFVGYPGVIATAVAMKSARVPPTGAF